MTKEARISNALISKTSDPECAACFNSDFGFRHSFVIGYFVIRYSWVAVLEVAPDERGS
jgi:hypothetical protein